MKGKGWIRDSHDDRDHLFTGPRVHPAGQLPTHVDLRPKMPPVYDQGELGSCTANAIAGAFEFDELSQKEADAGTPSRLFIYYNERVIENSVTTDSGAMLRDGIKTIAKQGVCAETLWPYHVAKFADKPSADAYQAALPHRGLEYGRVARDLDQMKTTLAGGLPFVFGIVAYASLLSDAVAKSGRVPMPSAGEAEDGGHALLAAGYDDHEGVFYFRNSWNTTWGMDGYGTIPYRYLLTPKLSDDFWVLRRISVPKPTAQTKAA